VFLCVCVCVRMCACVYVCMCVKERDGETGRERGVRWDGVGMGVPKFSCCLTTSKVGFEKLENSDVGAAHLLNSP